MAKRTKVARYNRHIQFYEVGEYDYNDGGQLVKEYVPFKKRWCYKKDLLQKNEERTEDHADTATKRVRLATRYTEDITQDMQFFVDGFMYDVISVGDPEGFFIETVIIGEVNING